MRYLRICTLCILIIFGAGLAGCGGADVNTKTYTTTLGQELQDLDKAYKDGIITEKQYEDSKKKLIKLRTKK